MLVIHVSTKDISVMQKVLHIRSSSGFYGAESVLITLLDQLSKYGYETHLAVIENYINQNRDLIKNAIQRNINIVEIPCSRRFDFNSIKKLLEFARKNNIQCVHTHDYKSHLYGLLVAKRLKLPCIATLHGWACNTTSLRIYQVIERILLKYFDSVVTVSSKMEEHLRSGLLTIRNTYTIPNGVNTELFHPGSYYDCKKTYKWSASDFVFCIIARLTEEKGHRVLLNAFKIVHSMRSNTRLLIVGDGPERTSLKEMVSNLGLDGIVCFAGTLSNINEILRCIDCYISSSKTEGMPMILLEAMASGTPIIATKVGAVDIMLSNNTGILVEPNNINELAHAMRYVTKNINEINKMAEQARQKCIEQFSAKKQADAYRKLYSNICT